MPTIRDVAKEAGVSVGTVSKVLNGRRVRPATRDKVERAIKKLKYRPHMVSAGLFDQSPTLGLVIPSVSNPFFASLARYVEDEASRHGYMVLLCNTDRDRDKEQRYLRLLFEKWVAGIIVFAPLTGAHDIEPITERGIPIIAIEHGFAGSDVDLISIDNAKGMKEAVRHLVALKHHRIALVTGPLSRPCNQARLDAFRDELKDLGIEPNPQFIRESSFEYQGGYHITWELLHLQPPPTAMILGNDLMAMGAMNAARDKGLSVPEHLSIVGFDDIPAAGQSRPRLTTVKQSIAEVGAEAVRLLVRREAETPVLPPTFTTELIVRESTGPCPGSEDR